MPRYDVLVEFCPLFRQPYSLSHLIPILYPISYYNHLLAARGLCRHGEGARLAQRQVARAVPRARGHAAQVLSTDRAYSAQPFPENSRPAEPRPPAPRFRPRASCPPLALARWSTACCSRSEATATTDATSYVPNLTKLHVHSCVTVPWSIPLPSGVARSPPAWHLCRVCVVLVTPLFVYAVYAPPPLTTHGLLHTCNTTHSTVRHAASERPGWRTGSSASSTPLATRGCAT